MIVPDVHSPAVELLPSTTLPQKQQQRQETESLSSASILQAMQHRVHTIPANFRSAAAVEQRILHATKVEDANALLLVSVCY